MRPFPFGMPDWRALEAQLDWYPHVAGEIHGTTEHFLHVASPEPCPGLAPVPARTHGEVAMNALVKWSAEQRSDQGACGAL